MYGTVQIQKIISDGYLDLVFADIGFLEKVYPSVTDFDDVIDYSLVF